MKYKNLFIFYLSIQLTSCKYFDPPIKEYCDFDYLSKDSYFYFYFSNGRNTLTIFCNKCNLVDKGEHKEDFFFTVHRLYKNDTQDNIKSNKAIVIEFTDKKYKEQCIKKIITKGRKIKANKDKDKIKENILNLYTYNYKTIYYEFKETDDVYIFNLFKEIILNKTKTKVETHGVLYYMKSKDTNQP